MASAKYRRKSRLEQGARKFLRLPGKKGHAGGPLGYSGQVGRKWNSDLFILGPRQVEQAAWRSLWEWEEWEKEERFRLEG